MDTWQEQHVWWGGFRYRQPIQTVPIKATQHQPVSPWGLRAFRLMGKIKVAAIFTWMQTMMQGNQVNLLKLLQHCQESRKKRRNPRLGECGRDSFIYMCNSVDPCTVCVILASNMWNTVTGGIYWLTMCTMCGRHTAIILKKEIKEENLLLSGKVSHKWVWVGCLYRMKLHTN